MSRIAAFYRVEGTLISRPTLATAAWFAANAQGVSERVTRIGQVALAVPLTMTKSLGIASLGARMTWMGLRGISEDRLRELAREYWEDWLRDEVCKRGLELVKGSQKRGHRIILISDNIDLVVQPLAEMLRAERCVCNRLEIRNEEATGRLCDPIVSGSVAGQWIRRFAEEHEIALEQSCGYGASVSDSLLLSALGHPCAVNPDWQLRRLASDHAWPVVDG
ncbi:MAG: haloacid dehalogenase-like hydrolase [Myxococcota bacterium]